MLKVAKLNQISRPLSQHPIMLPNKDAKLFQEFYVLLEPERTQE
jgi:hypothetical protein